MKSLFSAVIVCLLLIPLGVNAGEWIDTGKTDCKVWNESPETGETVSWSGKCVQGYASGSGTLIWSVSSKETEHYKGKFVYGTLIWSVNGKETERYEGELKEGKPTGKGTFTSANGDKYVGDFVDGNFHGKGTFTFANGDKYEGDWVDGKSTGKGTYTCSNGRQFTGNFENDGPVGFDINCN